ncbi:hypothetical protein WMF27_02915 [Sorangium sp. So ce281]|uniref:hypothetical protein n=1 Tax=unclassified Sorangium TaxID=2621164 RepID=UPI003F5EF926
MPEPLQSALYRLLHHRSFRDDFLAGRFDALGLEPRELCLLRPIDRAELVTLSESICRNVLRGELKFEGGMRGTFPDLFSLLERKGCAPLEVIYRFVESPEYEDVRQVPYAGAGISIEEAFFEFLRREGTLLTLAPYAPLLLTHEFLTGMLAILVINRDPSFELRTPLIRSNGAARYAVQRYPLDYARSLTERPLSADESGQVIFLYAAAPGRLLRGPSTAAAVALVERGRERLDETARTLAERGVSTTVASLSALADGLARLGVIA